MASIIKNYWRIRKKYNVIKITITGKLAGGTKRTKLKTIGYGRFAKNSIGRQIIYHFARFAHDYGEFGVKLGMSIKQGKSITRKRVKKKRRAKKKPRAIRAAARKARTRSRRRIFNSFNFRDKKWLVTRAWSIDRKLWRIRYFARTNKNLKQHKDIKSNIKRKNEIKSKTYYRRRMARLKKQYPKKSHKFVLSIYKEKKREMRQKRKKKEKKSQDYRLKNAYRLKVQENPANMYWEKAKLLKCKKHAHNYFIRYNTLKNRLKKKYKNDLPLLKKKSNILACLNYVKSSKAFKGIFNGGHKELNTKTKEKNNNKLLPKLSKTQANLYKSYLLNQKEKEDTVLKSSENDPINNDKTDLGEKNSRRRHKIQNAIQSNTSHKHIINYSRKHSAKLPDSINNNREFKKNSQQARQSFKRIKKQYPKKRKIQYN